MDWYEKQMLEYEADGAKDAERGIIEWPYPHPEDPQDIDCNEAYRRGFDRMRHKLGDKFKWA